MADHPARAALKADTAEDQLLLWQGAIAAAAEKGGGLDVYGDALAWAKSLPNEDAALRAAGNIRAAADRHIGEQFRAVLDALDRAAFPDAPADNVALDAIAIKTDEAGETDQEVQRLVALKPLEYERARKSSADRLGLRALVLDRLVEAARGQTAKAGQGQALDFPAREPWPRLVDGDALLSAMSDGLRSYVVMPAAQADAVALWALHTYCFERFTVTPRLAITSAEKGCGKTTLLDVVTCLVSRPLECANISAPAIFRTVELAKPSLMIDEADSFLKDNESLRNVLNSGHRKGGTVVRTVGDEHEPRRFATFAPAAIALIGRLPDTLHDRSIVIELRRRKATEPVSRFRADQVGHLFRLARMAARWVSDVDNLVDSDEDMGDLFNRAADNWRPLFAIAAAAGGNWPSRARAAAEAASSGRSDDSFKVALLADIRAIFAAQQRDAISSEDLVTALAALEGRPWVEFGKAAKPITKHKLASLLKGFPTADGRPIAPGDMWAGKSLSGYRLADFADAFERYLRPEAANELRDSENPRGTATCGDFNPRGDRCASDSEMTGNADLAGGLGVSESESPDDDLLM